MGCNACLKLLALQYVVSAYTYLNEKGGLESEACDQTMTLRYRVSLEGFVNMAQLHAAEKLIGQAFYHLLCVRVCIRGWGGVRMSWCVAASVS